ncbi:MAG: glycoside hydrolase family 3 C-terminal domain-containing protein [Nibricoccus sp.]
MKLSALLFASALSVISSMVTTAAPDTPYKTPVSYEDADKRAGDILAKFTLEQKLALISGHNMFFVKGFPEFGLPQLYLSDATGGVHIRKKLSGQLEKSTAFPAPIGLAATWNPDLAYEYAHSIGEECRAGDIAVLLGPGMNIYRQSQCGRSFEYFGEDPFLVSRMIERYVRGVLDTGTMATLKHFMANNTDYHRRTSNSVLDERTMHEIYLPGFKAGIAAGATAVMTSYNQVNGEWAGQSEFVIHELLRKKLGYRWLVMTDWWSVWDAEKIMKSGQDLEMPGDKFIKTDGLALVKKGKITEAQVDRMARSIVRTEIAMGLCDRPIKDESFLKNFPQHEQVALQTAREAIVLLKNTSGLLPLKKGAVRKILLTGKWVEKLPRGGGSAEVEGYNSVLLGDALRAVYGDSLLYVADPTDEQISSADVVLLSTGTFDSEGWDRSFAMLEADEALAKRVTSLNPRTVVIVNSGGGIKMTDWNEKAAAVVYAWYPGQIGNRALAEILCGDVNPSGKLPITIEKRFQDSPGANYVPAGEKLYTGWEPDNDMNRHVYMIEYKEGVFVGYRWYESKKIQPLYAFGHGLSYSTFKYSDLKLSANKLRADGVLTVEFTVANTGSIAGAETAQVYIRDVEASVPRPEKELKGFAKVTLKPGESRSVKIQLKVRDVGFWDVQTHDWKTEPGAFQVLVGGASDQIGLKAEFVVE